MLLLKMFAVGLKCKFIVSDDLDFRLQVDLSLSLGLAPDVVDQTKNIRGARLASIDNKVSMLAGYLGFADRCLL